MYKPLARSAVRKYFTTESQEKTREIFEKVHFPMDKIRVELCHEGKHGEFATEAQVAGWVLDVDGSAWRNRIFSIVGETGSGKSEFCQYLQYRASKSLHHVPILISRSTTRLAQIIRLLNDHAGLTDDADVAEVTDLSEAHIVSQSVAHVMRVTLTKQFKSRYVDSQLKELERAFQRESFKALIARGFAEYRAQVTDDGKERQLNLLNRKEFDLLFENTLPWLDLDSAYVACRDQIHEGVKALVQMGDMSGRLQRIAQRYKALKKRPLLIMEDLTSFGFMKEELLDYLFELNSGNFDVVIGWTTGFEAENLGSIFRTEGDGYTYMRERLRGRFAMTDAQRTSWFMEQHHVDMLARYIDAARMESGMAYAASDLYPVNANFVSNVYRRLIDDDKQPKKTPRLLLRAMQAILSRPDEPWLTATELVGQMLAPRPLADRLFSMEEKYPEQVRFLEWYGSPVDGKVSRKDAGRLEVMLPPELADFLTDAEPERGTQPEDGADPGTGDWNGDAKKETTEQSAPTRSTQDEAGAALDKANQAAAGMSDDRSKSVDSLSNPVDRRDSAAPAPKPDPLAKEKLDLQQWLQGGDFNLRRQAEKGLDALLSVYGDIAGLSNPRGRVTPVLNYAKSKVHAVFVGTLDKVESFPHVLVPRERSAHMHILTALTVGKQSRIREAAEAAFLQNPELVQWIGNLYDSYRGAQRTYLENRLGMPVERFVYHLYITVVGLTTGETGADIPSLVTFDPSETPAAPDLLCLKSATEVGELLRYRRTIASLFRSFFFLNPTTLDLPLLLKVREGYSPTAFFHAVAKVAREAIDQGFWLAVDDAEAKGSDKVLLSHLFTQAISLDGRLKVAIKESSADRQAMQWTEIRGLAAGLTETELRKSLRRIDGLLASMKRARPHDWNILDDTAPLDFASATGELGDVARWAREARDVFALVATYKAHTELQYKREIRVLELLHRVLSQLDADVKQAEGEVADKKFDSRSHQAVSDCRRQYDRLWTLAKEVQA